MTDSDHYYSAPYLINLLTRSVANGGNLLLDIGPAADGTIPTIMQERLLQVISYRTYCTTKFMTDRLETGCL